MRKGAVVLVALATAGIPAYLWVASSVLGVSPADPLGRFERIDAWLIERGFDKRAQPLDGTVRKAFRLACSDAELLVYRHGGAAEAGGCAVAVARDRSGRVIAVASRFRSGADDVGVPSSPGESFIGVLWVETAGRRPVFVEDRRGAGRFAQRVRVATFDANGIAGEWLKSYASPSDPRGIRDRVTLRVN